MRMKTQRKRSLLKASKKLISALNRLRPRSTERVSKMTNSEGVTNIQW